MIIYIVAALLWLILLVMFVRNRATKYKQETDLMIDYTQNQEAPICVKCTFYAKNYAYKSFGILSEFHTCLYERKVDRDPITNKRIILNENGQSCSEKNFYKNCQTFVPRKKGQKIKVLNRSKKGE